MANLKWGIGEKGKNISRSKGTKSTLWIKKLRTSLVSNFRNKGAQENC